MQTSSPSISALLGVSPAPSGLLAWHLLILSGLPGASLEKLAFHTGLPEQVLADAVGAPCPGTAKVLPPAISSSLYRVALTWGTLYELCPERAQAAEWLSQPQAALRGRVPLQLLASTIGYDYVLAAIGRQLGKH